MFYKKNMINQVYTTVLSILNKESRGYVTPTEFNMYAEMAQMSLFEELFHKYSKSLVKQNNRMYHSEYSDIPKHIREAIDIFISESILNKDSNGLYFYTVSNFYRGVKLDLLVGKDTGYNRTEVEEVSKLEANRILKNNLITPTTEYPIYIGIDGRYRVYPSLPVDYYLLGTYVRKPIQPKWTYNVIAGNPLFNPTAIDYQDFELPDSMFNDIVIKILSYCGIQIREAEIVQVSQAMDVSSMNNEQL